MSVIVGRKRPETGEKEEESGSSELGKGRRTLPTR